MSFTQTPNLALYKPTVGADNELWGGHWNSNADTLDATIHSFAWVADATAPSNAPTLTGYLNAPSTRAAYAQFAARRYATPVDSLGHNWDGGAIGVNGPEYSDDGVTTSRWAGAVSIGTGSFTGTRYGWAFGSNGVTDFPGGAPAPPDAAAGVVNMPGGSLVSTDWFNIGANLYNTETQWQYMATGTGALFSVGTNGRYYWYSAASGTPGEQAALTETMLLDLNGELFANGAVHASTGIDNGLYLVNDGSNRYLNFTTDGWKLLWEGGNLAYINHAGTWLWYSDPSGNVWSNGSTTANGNLVANNSVYAAGIIQSNGARVISTSGGNVMQSLCMWSQQNSYAAGLALGGAGDTNMYFCQMDGSGNYTGQMGYVTSGSDLVIHGNITAGSNIACQNYYVQGPLGVNYGCGNWVAFGWNGALNCYINNTYVGDVVGPSDARLKTDIAPSAVDCLDTLRRVELKQFRWIDTEVRSDALQPVGFTTQQLHDVLPGLVTVPVPELAAKLPHGRPSYQSVNHNAVLALLIGAVQQLSGRVEALEGRV